MKSLKTQFCELSRGLQQFLKEEYPQDHWISTQGDNLSFFRDLAKSHPVRNGPGKAPTPTPNAKTTPTVAPAPRPKLTRPRSKPKPSPAKEKPPGQTGPAKQDPIRVPETTLIPEESFEEVARFLAPVADKIQLCEQVPSDEEAIRISQKWKRGHEHCEVLFISLEEPPRARAFWLNVVRAVDKLLAPCAWIQVQEEGWDQDWKTLFQERTRKLLVVHERQIERIPGLKEQYDAGKRTLWGIPLLLVPDAQTYFRDPAMKASLWQALCKVLQS